MPILGNEWWKIKSGLDGYASRLTKWANEDVPEDIKGIEKTTTMPIWQ
ncbi:MAG: hypothetical protein M3162_07505 [Thermoproteota archaeon]|nr:hypothetical protein [Thermoproteota archaeon]